MRGVRVWNAVVSLITVGCLTVTGCGGGLPVRTAADPLSVVRQAIRNTERTSAHVRLDIEQSTGPQAGASGDGVVDYSAAKSNLVLAVKSGGGTDVRQVDGTLYLRSYNTPMEQVQSTWVQLDPKLTASLLDWPPRGLTDPAYLFASSELLHIIETRLVGAAAVDPAALEVGPVKRFNLELTSFSPPPSNGTPVTSAGPILSFWIDNAGRRVQRIVLSWPTTRSGATAGGPSDGFASANRGAIITITLTLDEFGRKVIVSTP